MKKNFQTKSLNQKNQKKEKIPKKTETPKELDNDVANDKYVDELYNDKEFIKPIATNSRTLVYSLVVSIIFGFFAGLVCLFLFLSGAFSNSNIFSWLDIDSVLPTAHVIIEKHEQTTVEEDERVNEVANEVSSSVVGIFVYKNSIGDVQQDTYSADEFLGNGLILTNDGWIATTNDVVSGNSSYAIVTQEGDVYKTIETEKDEKLGVVFLKVEAENLPVVALLRWEDVSSGERTMVMSGIDHFNKQLLVSRVADKDFQISYKLVRNTEDYYLFINLIHELDKKFLGTPVFNLNKQALGLVTSYNNQNYIIPIDYFKKSFDQMLSQQKIKDTYLGIEYVNLVSAINPDFDEAGALIIKIAKDSPARGLEADVGDIIIKIDDDNINGNRNLTNLVQQYKTDNKITLTVLDKDDMTEKVVEVFLK